MGGVKRLAQELVLCFQCGRLRGGGEGGGKIFVWRSPFQAACTGEGTEEEEIWQRGRPQERGRGRPPSPRLGEMPLPRRSCCGTRVVKHQEEMLLPSKHSPWISVNNLWPTMCPTDWLRAQF